MSFVEEALRSQRQVWREITERVTRISNHDLSPEAPRRIIFFGVGSSHHAARLCAYAMLRDKNRARTPVIACSSTAIGVEVFPTRGDWVFGLSHRGKSASTLAALEQADRAGAYPILVSGNDVLEPPFARYVLGTSPMEKCEPHTMSLTGAICAVTTLLLGSRAAEEWDAIASMGDPDLESLKEKAGQGPTIVLGEWEGEWIAREGCLKLTEMAGVAPHVYSSEEFFHGPKRKAKNEDRIWHVAHPKDLRNSEIQAAHQMQIFGGSVLAWLPALVEIQWLSLAVALNRGVDPDSGGAG